MDGLRGRDRDDVYLAAETIILRGEHATRDTEPYRSSAELLRQMLRRWWLDEKSEEPREAA